MSLYNSAIYRPLTAKLCWCPFSSVPHVSDHLESHISWASWTLHLGPSKSSGIPIELCCCARYTYRCAQIHLCVETMQEALSKLRTTRAYVTCRVFENEMAALNAVSGKKTAHSIPFACLFPVTALEMSDMSTGQDGWRANWKRHKFMDLLHFMNLNTHIC